MTPASSADPEHDPRTSFANERTMLAWVRTAIALMAGGAALAELGRGRDGGRDLMVPAIGLVALGALLAVASLVLWRQRERAIVAGRLLPAGSWPLWLLAGAIGVGAVASAVVVVVWT